MAIEVYTDAGFKDGVSTHHWRVLSNGGKRIKRRTFAGNEIDNHKAEMQSINSAIQWLTRKGYEDVVIYTDSMYCVKLLNDKNNKNNDISYMQWQMKGSNIKIEWITRENKMIKLADYYCTQLQQTVFNRKEFSFA